jgi:Ca-activated chloride channel family protein
MIRLNNLPLRLMLLASIVTQVGTSSVKAKQVQLDVALAHPTMLIDQQGKGENHLRVALTGFELPAQKDRLPVNVAIVIDKSGSMQGEKIAQARRAAIQAVDRLRDSDIVSIVTYDSSVEVLCPATKASDRQHIKAQIQTIQAGGNTALFAGVSKGASEIRKFLDDKRVNRVVLLSDGLANVGPDTPSELEELGESLIKEGISVSTMGLGLGYNEDLMSRLALASSGNHVFIEDAENLVEVFQNEFDDVLSVVAQRIRIQIELAEGVRPVKLLNYPADITGQHVSIDVGQLYSKQERYFVLEIEVPYGKPTKQAAVAEVTVQYMNLFTETQDKLSSQVAVKFTEAKDIAEAAINKEIMAACVIQIANERNREATRLRDAGRIDEARSLLQSNGVYLEESNVKLQLPGLQSRAALNYSQAQGIDNPNWSGNRKRMVEQQFGDSVQQSYRGTGKTPD